MQEVDKFSILLVLLVFFLAGGLLGVKWLTLAPLVIILGFFLLDFHASSKNKLVDMATIIMILLAIAIGLSSKII